MNRFRPRHSRCGREIPNPQIPHCGSPTQSMRIQFYLFNPGQAFSGAGSAPVGHLGGFGVIRAVSGASPGKETTPVCCFSLFLREISHLSSSLGTPSFSVRWHKHRWPNHSIVVSLHGALTDLKSLISFFTAGHVIEIIFKSSFPPLQCRFMGFYLLFSMDPHSSPNIV